MALFNHSCSPNAAITHLPPHSECHTAMVVVAENGIAKGTEIVYSYNSECLIVPLRERRQRLLSNWGFLCKCGRCEEEEKLGDDQNHEASQAAELADLLSQEDSKLRDLELYRTREEVLHHPGIAFSDRKRLFSTQLAAAVCIFPYLHPNLGSIYEELHDLCEDSPHKSHCQKVQEFFQNLGEKGSATWEAGS
eukprot:symbB.v1.2.039864.t1/scaffold6838.1/size15098/2